MSVLEIPMLNYTAMRSSNRSIGTGLLPQSSTGVAVRLMVAFMLMFVVSAAHCQEYSVEKIDAAPEPEGVSSEIAKLIADHGVRVKRGSTRTLCEIWLCKELAIDPEFKPAPERLYPFTAGQLIGLLHFPRRGKEFRDQTVSSGWYTLRFGLQPVDGNHEGTSPTRDFFLLVAADADDLPENWEQEDLNAASAEAAGSSHPAMLCLQRPTKGSELTIRHDETNDWWIAHFVGKGVAGKKSRDVPIDLVVVGHATE